MLPVDRVVAVKKGEVAKAYEDRARYLRESASKSSFGEIVLTRKDGWSDDIPADQVTVAGESVSYDTIRYLRGISLRWNDNV